MDNQRTNTQLDIIGKTIAGLVCYQYFILKDVLVIQDVQGNAKAIMLSSLSGNMKLPTIENQSITNVQVARNGTMFLFATKTKSYLVNEQFEIIENSDEWADAYFESLSNSFYRKDAQGHWYDIEGFRMQEKVFLKEDVLTSLESKTSKQSVSFKNCDLFISKNKQLIQLGKLVLDTNLNVIKFFGERITGLGRSNISFGDKDVLQEVKLGIDDSAFINEYTHEPYMFGDTKITKHVESHQYGKKRVEIFQVGKNFYGVEGSSDHFLTYDERPLEIDTEKHVNFRNKELIKVSDGQKSFYFDLNKNEVFVLPNFEDVNLNDIDQNFVRVDQSKIFNVLSSTEQFAIYESDGTVFKLDNETIVPQKIEDAEGLKKYYGFAMVDGQRKLFSKKTKSILKFGTDALEVSEIIYNPSDKLINALDTNGNKLVLDLRLGFDQITMAETNGEKVSEVYGALMPIANKTLLNVFVETLGGQTRRVIDINQKELSYFTIPSSLKEISDQDTPSVFANNYICEVHFFEELVLEGRSFIAADFESFTGKEYPIILERETGHPIHLQGSGHRNELALSWLATTVEKPYYLGNDRMMCVATLSEDQKENSLLFSVQKLTSWLPFFDSYLPIFKQIVDVKEQRDDWDYHLFELREAGKDKEYIAIEKVPPYRILADRKSGEYKPRIVKSKKKNIKSPEEMSSLQRFFYADSGFLVEIE